MSGSWTGASARSPLSRRGGLCCLALAAAGVGVLLFLMEPAWLAWGGVSGWFLVLTIFRDVLLWLAPSAVLGMCLISVVERQPPAASRGRKPKGTVDRREPGDAVVTDRWFWGTLAVVALLPLAYGVGVLTVAWTGNEAFRTAAAAAGVELVMDEQGVPVGYRTEAGEDGSFADGVPEPVLVRLQAEAAALFLKTGAVAGGCAGVGLGMLAVMVAGWARRRRARMESS